MKLQTRFRIAILCLSMIICLPFLTVAQEFQCASATAGAISANSIIGNVKSLCCAKRGKRRQKRCRRSNLRKIKRVRPPLPKSVARAALAGTRNISCRQSEQVMTFQDCDTSTFTSTTEALALIEAKSCNKRFRSDRQTRLKKFRRSLSRARKAIGRDASKVLRQEIRGLMRAPSCGRGGKVNKTGCKNTRSARDGANGNVYKMSDHGGLPVFVTHDGSRNGTAISKTGKTLDTLRYTGLANRDPRGLRHHYRFNVRCSDLPQEFYIKLNNTCYSIDKRCGRVD